MSKFVKRVSKFVRKNMTFEVVENDNIDKFVYLDKSCYMVCVYNAKFKKWVPIKIAEKGAKVISQREMEKNKY